MLVNYIKIAFRNLSKQKLFACINVAGLAVSMSLGLLILTLVSDLLSYDDFHTNKNDIFRITTKVESGPGNSDTKATCPVPVADELAANYKGYRHITRIQRFFSADARYNQKALHMEGYFTDPAFLEIFSFKLTRGNPETALASPSSIVITETVSLKLFGKEDPMGKIISMGKFGEFMVTGIVSDPPANSHLHFEILGSFSSLLQMEKDAPASTGIADWEELFRNYVYVQRSPGITENKINQDLALLSEKGNSIIKDKKLSFQLQSIKNIVPGPDLSTQIGPKMSWLPITIMSAVALLILLSACINYTNLSLARALRRAREIGIRKAIGGSKKQLLAQLLTETCTISLISLVAAWIIFQVIRPEFLQIVPRANEMFSLQVTPMLVLAFIGFALFTALAAGMLPAFVLSGFNTIKALKQDTTLKALGRINLRKALIVFQFTLSMIFIIGVVVIYRQYRFAVSYNHGFSLTNKMVVPLEGMEYSIFRNEFEKNPEIKSVAGASALIGGNEATRAWLMLPGNADSLSANYISTDEGFIEQLGISLMAGNGFRESRKAKEQSIIINERLAIAMGAKKPQDALGRTLVLQKKQMEVIGVVRDFNYAHLEEPIRNFIFMYEPANIQYAYLSFAGEFNKDVNKSLAGAWTSISGDESFKGITMEAFMEENYAFYENFIKIFGFVAFLAITIGCLGLFGISFYVAQSRLKEVSIRKVMGASVASILLLLSKGFIWLLLLTSVIALPVSYLLFSLVLENGVYHIDVDIVELGSGVMILLLVGGVTIISQIWKAAVSNPVKNLRTE